MELLEWDAKTYDQLPLPHKNWGAGVVERLSVRSGETVLDLGCGTGRDAQRVLDAVPDAQVIGVDGSEQMLEQARERFAKYPQRTELIHADLQKPLQLPKQVDAAMTVAALHWVADHQCVFESIFRALRPGGRFVGEWGGQGNIASVSAAVQRTEGYARPHVWKFASLEETTQRLDAAGFVDVSVALLDDPARLERGPQLEAYLATVILGAALRDMTPKHRKPFVQGVAANLAEPVIDYVRIHVSARRPG